MSKRIAIEGMDGSGKSTVARAVVDWLRKGYCHAELFPYPTEGEVGKFIRSILSGKIKVADIRAMLPLFIADAVEQERAVEAMIARGYYVVMDRHPWVSAFAFQVDHHAGHNILHAYNAFELPKPELLFILDVPAKMALERCGKRGKYEDAVYVESLENLEKLRCRYKDIATTPHPARPDGPGSRTDQKTWLVDGSLPLNEIVQFIINMSGGAYVRR